MIHPISNRTVDSHSNESTSPLFAAQEYAAAGWAVFPAHGINNGRCTCGGACASPGKHPRIVGGLTQASKNQRQIENWFRRWPTANVAIRTGKESGLVVIDVDPEHGGLESLRDLIKEHGPLPPTLTVATGSDGLHFYFEHPGTLVRNSASTRLGPGLDVRGDGGYVIGAPSRHISGGRYRWVNEIVLEPMPSWMDELVREPRHVERTTAPNCHTVNNAEGWAKTALQSELCAIQHAPEGQRNHTLNRAAFNLGQIVGGGSLLHGDVHTVLVESGMSIGLSESECLKTVASGMRAGASLPRSGAKRSHGKQATDYAAFPENVIHL